MDNKVFRTLEFDKIIEILKSYAVSSMGKDRILGLVPEKDFDMVKKSLEETKDASFFLKVRGAPSIDGITDISDSLRRLELGGGLNLKEFLRILDNMKVTLRLKQHLDKQSVYSSHGSKIDEYEVNENVIKNLITSLQSNKTLHDKISRTVISEDDLADDASSSLYSIRKEILNLQESVKQRLNSIVSSSKYQKYIQDHIVTIRSDRYVIPVKQEFKSELPGIVHDASSSGATIFVEPMAVVQINNNIREARANEQREIERILKELSEEVSSFSEKLIINQHLLTDIDFLFAKAKFSLDYNCVCPFISDDKNMNIIEGRHPLLDPDNIVPIDFWIGDKFKTLVITGPNTGGKTVALKTVGLFCLMTQAGLLIPAKEGTKMGMFENVFADIGDEQSIEQSLSTFSSHMTNIVGILNKANCNDLVLFDELGAGTDPQEGAGLAISILKELLNRQTITVATTHYSQLKSFALTNDLVENACCEFDVATLKPTFKLLIGIPGKSNAFSISEKLGLDENILSNARDSLGKEETDFEDVLVNLQENLKNSEKNKIQTQIAFEDAKKYRDRMGKELEKVQTKRTKIIEDARQKAKELLDDALRDVDLLISNMKEKAKQVQSQDAINEARNVKQELRRKVKSTQNTLNSAKESQNIERIKMTSLEPSKVKEGDTVFVYSLNTKAKVLKTVDKSGKVTVLAGVMKVNVNLSDLGFVKEEEKKGLKDSSGHGQISKAKARDIKSEISFRGYTVDEAVLELDKYLDDAKLAGLKEVRVIHGKGTGALRAGLHDFLKFNGCVKSYKLAEYGEGDAGVTVVEIK